MQPGNLGTWTWQYNLNLIGQDRFPPGEARTELAVKAYEYHVQLRNWTWNYNLNLIGKDQLPAGEQFSELPPRAYEYRQQVISWTWNYNLNLIGQDRLPVGKQVSDLPPKPYDYRHQIFGWTWNYNLSLIGKDQLPVGEISTALPTPRDYPNQLRQWFGAAPPQAPVVTLPSNQYDWPVPQTVRFDLRTWISSPAVPAPVVDTANIPARVLDWGDQIPARGLQPSWTSSYNIALNTVVGRPFSQYDWPLTPAPRPIEQTLAVSYNRNLVGQDALPVGEQRTDLAPRSYEHHVQLRSWVWSFNLNLIAQFPVGQQRTELWSRPAQQPTQVFVATYNVNLIGQDRLPFRQQDWPLPNRGPAPIEQTITASYNKNLIGQDALPPGKGITDISPQPPLSAIQLRTWIQSVNLALITTPPLRPFNQFDWPLTPAPRQPALSWTVSYNPNLIGKDALPVRQQQWPLPIPFARQPDLSSWTDRPKGFLQRPFAQYDWPVPRAPQQPALSFTASYNPNLIGKDRLPFRQQDWPLPQGQREVAALRTFIAFAQARPVFKPFAQYHWPLPQAPIDPYWQRSITQGRAIFGGAVIPTVPGVIDLVTVFLASYYGVFFAEEVIKGTPLLAAQEPGADFVSEVETGTVDLTENYAKDQKKAAD